MGNISEDECIQSNKNVPKLYPLLQVKCLRKKKWKKKSGDALIKQDKNSFYVPFFIFSERMKIQLCNPTSFVN